MARRHFFYLSEAAIAAIACLLLVRRQRTAVSPLLPVDLLRIPIFTLSICTSIASFCAQMLALVALPFYLYDHFGYSAVEIGLLITPWPIAIAFVAPVAGRLVERYPAGLLGGIGLLPFAAGLGTLAFLPAHPAMLDVVWRMALSGVGFGLFRAPNNRTMIAAAPRERSGGASGMLGTARLLGQTIGAALVALLLARYSVAGTQIALLVGAGVPFLARRSAGCGCRLPAHAVPNRYVSETANRARASEPLFKPHADLTHLMSSLSFCFIRTRWNPIDSCSTESQVTLRRMVSVLPSPKSP